MSKKRRILIGMLASLMIGISIAVPVYTKILQEQREKQEEERRLEKLYKHGFRLLEEQIATYIVEHYSGVSKVEFSPIFSSGGGSQSFLSLDVVPVVYDEHGNRALLAGSTSKGNFSAFGYQGDIYALELDEFDNEIIDLSFSAKGESIDVSSYDNLPDDAKLDSYNKVDDVLTARIEDGEIKDILKSKDGSSEVKITYNLEIKRGNYETWH